MFLVSSRRNTCVGSYELNSDYMIGICPRIRIRMRIRFRFLPPLQNPCECAEERSFKRIRASDCLSEASSSSTPLEASTGRCPQRSGGTQTPGSPFLLLTLLLAKQKKSESPAAATERHQDFAMCMLVQSKTNSGSGVFGVGAQIPRAFGSPFGCCAALRFAAKLRSDPENQAVRGLLRVFSASSPRNTCASSYENSSVHECDLTRIRSRTRPPKPL